MAEEESRENDRAPEAMVWAPLEGELVSVSEASQVRSSRARGTTGTRVPTVEFY
jgi:hypothetical protein